MPDSDSAKCSHRQRIPRWPLRVSGARASSVRPSLLKQNRVTCEVSKRSQRQHLLRVPSWCSKQWPLHRCHNICESSGEAETGLHRTWASPHPGASHGRPIIFSRLEEYRHHRHAAVRRAVRPVSYATCRLAYH